MALTPIKLYRGDAENRLVESFVGFTDGGGAGQPLIAAYSGNDVNVADGVTEKLTWDVKTVGEAVLDLTAPADPEALVAGLYIVTVTAVVDGTLTAAGYFDAHLAAGYSDVRQTSPPVSGAFPQVCLTVPVRLDVGDTLNLLITNHDGAAARNFALLGAMIAVIPSS